MMKGAKFIPRLGDGKPRGAAGVRVSAKARAALAEANMARDTKNWSAAAEFYGQYLAEVSDDAPIWVQRGNCAKEAGEYPAAKDAYEHALALMPKSADLHLQMGHLSKLTGNFAGALAFYRKAAELDPASADAKHEVASTTAVMDDMPFLLPQTLFPGKAFDSIAALLEYVDKAGGAYDPFEKYNELIA